MEDPDALEKRLHALLAYQNTVSDELQSKSGTLLRLAAAHAEDAASTAKRLKLYERPYQRMRAAIQAGQNQKLRQFQRMDDGEQLIPHLHGAARARFLGLLHNIQYEYYAAHFSAAQEALLRLGIQCAVAQREAVQMRQDYLTADQRVKELEQQLVQLQGLQGAGEERAEQDTQSVRNVQDATADKSTIEAEQEQAQNEIDGANPSQTQNKAQKGHDGASLQADGSQIEPRNDATTQAPVCSGSQREAQLSAEAACKSTQTDGTTQDAPNSKQLGDGVSRGLKQDMGITLPASCVQAQPTAFERQDGEAEGGAAAWQTAPCVDAQSGKSAFSTAQRVENTEAGLLADRKDKQLDGQLEAVCRDDTSNQNSQLQRTNQQDQDDAADSPHCRSEPTGASEALSYFQTLSSCSRTQEQYAMLAEAPSSTLLLQLFGEHIAQCSQKSETLIKEALQISIDLGKAPL